jgi:polyisoprenyl-phosphate glycosyltransferase
VVLPVYHNRRQLPELHRRLTQVLGQLTDRYELVFVDDAGQDGSLEWLRECRRVDDRVVLVEMPYNGGQHRAVAAGLRIARGDIVAVMDADLQDRPEALPGLVAALGPDVGAVFARHTVRHQSRGRHITGRLFKRLLRRTTSSRVPAGTGMFFVTSRLALDAVLAVPEEPRYVPLLFDHAGVTMTGVDVAKELRPDSTSAYSAGRRLRLALDACRHALEWRRAQKRAARSSSGFGTDDPRQRHL